ncbi:MAG TPA: D-alanine--D-alanine ligase family protein [Solirubrobacteraceae bacterium]|jgi:D-alanine-D-alanine ligase|nr:D-alanine--D-alanine ligase family protein [Solirubrobacteraceae bacterium]
MPSSGLRVGVAFGGRSVEHDVSIITGLQALSVLEERHRPLPIYIARSGRWYTGDALRELSIYQQDGGDPEAEEVNFDLHRGRLLGAASGGGSLLRARRSPEPIELDAVLLATHGTQGEDGCLQGALELARLPYIGPPVGAAAAAMDKVTTKAILAQAGLPALDHLAVRREEWDDGPEGDGRERSPENDDPGGGVARARARERLCARVRARFELPLYVKPASLGSSVGVSRCSTDAELEEALELGFELDRVCLVEPSVEGGREVNCAVIGRPGVEPRASVCEQPVAAESFLSFEDKYMGGAKSEGMKGAQRLIPAPIGDRLTAQVQELARRAFSVFGCAGVTRVDFLIDAQERVYVNELNTIPGSFSFYLWEPAGLPFAELMDELIDLALADHREKLRTTTVFATSLLAERASGAKTAEKA